MPRQRGLHGDLRRLLIADFTDEHDVGIVAENRAQAAGKRQAGFFRHLDLVHALELILDRIFDRDDLALGVVNFVERGIERRRLAGARRTGDEHDAVGELEHALQAGELALAHAEVAGAAEFGILPQQTHDHRFTVQHRDDRDADIHLGVFNANLDATVLRETFFRDIEMTEDLDARHDGRLETFDLRRHRHFL